AENSPCYEDTHILKFNKNKKSFTPVDSISTIICDGLGIAKTRMRALIDGYQFNNKVLFDTHRSMTIALINLKAHRVIGYLIMPINRGYLINRYLKPELEKAFGSKDNEGVTVWLMY